MALIKLGNIDIQAESLGFPATVVPTEDQVAARVVSLAKDVDMWRKRAEDSQKNVEKLKAHEMKIKEMECEMLLDEATRSFKIDANAKPFLRKMWQTNPTAVKDHLEGLRSNEWLKREAGLSGDIEGPTDPVAEVMAKAAELIANDKTLTQGDALLEVLKKHPELSDRYRAAMLSGTKGGGN